MPQFMPSAELQALTAWWTEMGVDVDSAELAALQRAPPAAGSAPPDPVKAAAPARRKKKNKGLEDWVEEARTLANAATDMDTLAKAIEGFGGCPLREGAQNTVVFDGVPGASLMVIGEGPGAEEDRKGLPFVGKAGQLLDKMLAAIGRSRTENVLISNVNYWRPPGNRNPDEDELAVCRPFVDRMVELCAPKLIIAAGGVPAKALLDTSDGIMKLRGQEHVFTTPGGADVPLVPILHPAYLLRRSQDKSRAWRDLLLIEARLAELE